jgi:hypothetical protein
MKGMTVVINYNKSLKAGFKAAERLTVKPLPASPGAGGKPLRRARPLLRRV